MATPKNLSRAPGGQFVTLEDCRSLAPAFGEALLACAQQADVEPRALRVRSLLTLPRVAGADGTLRMSDVVEELRQAAAILAADLARVRRQIGIPARVGDVAALSFDRVDPDIAFLVMESLHYLKSPRLNSESYGLIDPATSLPVVICSVAPMDWAAVAARLETLTQRPRTALLDLCRLYSFDSAPQNSVSVLLSRLRARLREVRPGTDLLSTVVDPNLGFTGSSYLASGWHLWLTVSSRRWIYDHGRYVTSRELIATHPDLNLRRLLARHPDRYTASRCPLLDAMVFCAPLSHRARRTAAPLEPFQVIR